MQGCKEPMAWDWRYVVDGPATTRSIAAPFKTRWVYVLIWIYIWWEAQRAGMTSKELFI